MYFDLAPPTVFLLAITLLLLLLLLPVWQTSILSWKTADSATLRVLLLWLLWLGYTILFLSSFALEGATEAGEQTGRSSILESVQLGFKGMSTIISVCFCSLQKKGLGEREIMIVIHFPEGKKVPTNSICLQRK